MGRRWMSFHDLMQMLAENSRRFRRNGVLVLDGSEQLQGECVPLEYHAGQVKALERVGH